MLVINYWPKNFANSAAGAAASSFYGQDLRWKQQCKWRHASSVQEITHHFQLNNRPFTEQ